MNEQITVTLPAASVEASSSYDHMNGYASWPEEPCPCGGEMEDGAPLRKIGAEWMHERCAVTKIQESDVDAAWLLLADQVVARPSAFRATDVKAIMRNVAAIARRTAS